MKLHDYLAQNAISQAKFAEIVTDIVLTRYGLEVKVSQQAISKACRQDFLPSRKEIVCAIYAATGGEVAPNDFYDLRLLEELQEAAA